MTAADERSLATGPASSVGVAWSLRRDALDEAALCGFAERLGARLTGGDVVLLHGPMGAGKTTFTRALARGLGVVRPDRVCSPTFAVRVEHRGPHPLVHMDLCRLVALGDDEHDAAPAAFEALGLGEDIDPNAVLVVEWAEAWTGAWGGPPPEHLRVELHVDPAAPDRRHLVLTGRGRTTLAAEAAVRAV